MAEDEERFFDGEKYVTRDEFFNSDDEENEQEPQANRKWIKVTIAGLLAVVLLTNILAFWPQVYNIAAIKFLTTSRELSTNEAVQQYKQSVVVVSTGKGNGTGFSISTDGYIVTNHHVIAEKEHLIVRFPEGKSHPADIVVSVPDIDLAILKINDDDQVFPKLDLQSEQAWEQDSPVYVIGNPLLFSFIANEGNVVGQTELHGWDIPVLVIDAPIYKGNSGSPVINHDGEVIGVVFATTKLVHDGQKKKVGLAIPIEYVEKHIQSLK